MVADPPRVVALPPPVVDRARHAVLRVRPVVRPRLDHVALVPDDLVAALHRPAPQPVRPRPRRERQVQRHPPRGRRVFIDMQPHRLVRLDDIDPHRPHRRRVRVIPTVRRRYARSCRANTHPPSICPICSESITSRCGYVAIVRMTTSPGAASGRGCAMKKYDSRQWSCRVPPQPETAPVSGAKAPHPPPSVLSHVAASACTDPPSKRARAPKTPLTPTPRRTWLITQPVLPAPSIILSTWVIGISRPSAVTRARPSPKAEAMSASSSHPSLVGIQE